MASVHFIQLIQRTFFESLLCSRHRDEEDVVTEIEGLTPVIAGGLWGSPEGAAELEWSEKCRNAGGRGVQRRAR